jgi:cation diffusion facilitator CzcD-associated flavoprotein CzcO
MGATEARMINGAGLAAAAPDEVRIAIIGAGFSGIGLGIKLLEAGIEDFVLLERADDLGGAWRDNSYPGCCCDVPSVLYSYSFAPKPDWSHTFSPQAEIWEYLRDCADRCGVTPHIRFGAEVRDASWDEGVRRWRVQTAGGEVSAQFLVAAQGGLSEPSIPEIPGLERFAGPVFHSARWDHGHDLTGERVAVVGTGASAIQFVPQIQPKVGKLTVHQRTAPWVMPRRVRPISAAEHALFRALPPAELAARGAIYWGRETFVLGFMHPERFSPAERIARAHLERQVKDPVLREKLTPTFRIGCKRILAANDWYPAITAPNAEVVTDPIAEIRPGSVVAADGKEREADTIIFGTGFHVTDIAIADRIHGRGGASLEDAWEGSPKAYLGTTVAGFPNLFLMTGPNTGLGHTSIVFMIESQIRYLLDALRVMDARGVDTIEVQPEAQAAFVADVDERLAGSVWNTGGCASWYLDATGRNSTIWPGGTWAFRRRLRHFDPGSYRAVRSSEPAAVPVAA